MDNNTSATHSEIINTNLNLLTPREWDVLLLVAGDISNQEIAEELHITPESVKTYRARIAEKLLMSGRDGIPAGSLFIRYIKSNNMNGLKTTV